MKGILCFGDSITFGRGEIPNKSWCGRLKDYFDPKGSHNGVYNLGVPGQTSTDLLERFDAEAKGRVRIKWPEDKYLILVAIGTNDSKWDGMPEDDNPRVTEDDFRKNIHELVKKAKAVQAGIAFIGLPPVDESKTLPFEETAFKNERVKMFNDVVKEVCKENDILFLDMFELMSKEDYTSFLADGLHPNSAGYDFMFKHVREFIEKNDLI
jgi:lysophospholipase L1-like esterase